MSQAERYERYVAYCRLVEVEPKPFEWWARQADGLDLLKAQRVADFNDARA